MADFKKIKAEYIKGGTSYRKLAEKYGVPRSTLERKAKDEKWTELRRQVECKTEAKIVDAISDDAAEKAVNIIDVADKLLKKINDSMDDMISDSQSVKHLTSALKDLKEIKGYKSSADMREQEARINKLIKEAAKETEGDKNIEVVLSSELEEYSE